jgi:hypothetical protein
LNLKRDILVSKFAAFKSNVCRYSAAGGDAGGVEEGCRGDHAAVRGVAVHVDSPDPWLKGAWFQTLTLEHQSWFQNMPFKFNLRRCNEEHAAVMRGRM